jgi:RNA polymerase sigma factor (sigma-70 family)
MGGSMKSYEISDQELINLYIQGNHSCLEDLISRHKNKIFSYILTVVKDRHLAEDLFQDTFMKVINTIKSGNYKEEGKFIQWAMRIAHNLTIDYFRKSKRFPTVENGGEYDIFETLNMMDRSVEQRLVFDQVLKDVRRLVDYLPPEQRQVVLMRHYEDLSFKEIADQTDVSINTALGRMRYALINLRKLIKDKDVILTY